MHEDKSWDELLNIVQGQKAKLKEYQKIVNDKNSTYNKEEVHNYIKIVNENFDNALKEFGTLEETTTKVQKQRGKVQSMIERIEERDGDNYFSTHPLMMALLGLKRR
jgi:hypothetical protein